MYPQETNSKNGGGENAINFYSLTLPAAKLRDTAFSNKNIVLKFFISDTINLHGWILKKKLANPNNPNSQFNDSPDLKLEIKEKTELSLGGGLYFGNQALYWKTLKVILREVGERPITLLFTPALDSLSSVYYTIQLVSEHGTLIGSVSDYKTNPSPPRNGYDDGFL